MLNGGTMRLAQLAGAAYCSRAALEAVSNSHSWHEENCSHQCSLIHPMQLVYINVDK